MRVYITKKNRALVKHRAKSICEYCLKHEDLSFIEFHIDHIISLKHGGTNSNSNLAYCCSQCNYCKGSDLGSFLGKNSKILIPFFNPREEVWFNHFEIKQNLILGKTSVGKVTEKIFQFNTYDRIRERGIFIQSKLFPHPDTPNFTKL